MDKGIKKLCLRHSLFLFTVVILVLTMLVGCGGPSIEELEAVEYTPLLRDDWEVSKPVEQGLAPMLIAELYYNAAKLDTIYGLLVIKNGHLVAERYFNPGSVDQKARLQSVTKSYTSALIGIALEQGYLSSVDQKMIDFFPELAGKIADPRKEQITIRQMLQMRAGYPSEETDPVFWEGLLSGHYPPLIEEFPLIADPGTGFNYSNLTSKLAGDHRRPGVRDQSQVILLNSIFSQQLMWRQANGDRMQRAITTAVRTSIFQLAMRLSSAFCISTTVNTKETRSFPPTGCMIPCRGTRRISMRVADFQQTGGFPSATSGMAISGGPQKQATIASTLRGDTADN